MDVYAALPDRIRVLCEAVIMVLKTVPKKGADIDSVSNQHKTNIMITEKTYIDMLRMAQQHGLVGTVLTTMTIQMAIVITGVGERIGIEATGATHWGTRKRRDVTLHAETCMYIHISRDLVFACFWYHREESQ